MALVFGNEMSDAVAKQAASEAAPRGAAAEQVSWVDALAWQVQRRIVEADLQASKTTPAVLVSREKGLRREQYKTVLQLLFEQRWECQDCKQSMGETSLVSWLRAGPCVGEIQTMQSIVKFSRTGSATGSCGSIHSNWVEDCASLAFSGPMSRHYVVLELCGMDFSISVQIEYAVFGSDQGVSARRFE